jgi:hypothetical protein
MLSRAWQVAFTALLACAVVLASLVVLYAVPMKSVERSQSNPFGFIMDNRSVSWAPNGNPPCTNCTAAEPFVPPSNAVGPSLVAFVWYSNCGCVVDFSLLSDAWSGPPPIPWSSYFLYQANGTHGYFAINSTATVVVNQLGQRALWWESPTPFAMSGNGTVTVEGAITYTGTFSVPLW